MNDLIVFLRAQLDEDERLARAACEYAEAEWRLNDIGDTILCFAPEPRVAENERRLGLPVTADQWRGITIDHATIIPHMAEHDPARVLRAVAGKRRILDLYVEHARLDRETFEAEGQHARSLVSLRAAYLDAVRAFATEYAHRPGYREEWKP